MVINITKEEFHALTRMIDFAEYWLDGRESGDEQWKLDNEDFMKAIQAMEEVKERLKMNNINNLIRVDFGTNRVEKTREEWINELIQSTIKNLDAVENNDSLITYLLKNGFKGYENMTDDELIDEISNSYFLGCIYDLEEDSCI